MAKAHELKRGSIVSINGVPHAVEQLTVSTPSARGAATLYHFKFRNLITKESLPKNSCKGDESFDNVDFEKRPVSYQYCDKGMYAFMDDEDFSQFEFSEEQLGDARYYLSEGMVGLFALVADGKILTVAPPPKVVLKIVECDSPMRSATVTSRPKPAKMATGLTVMVPEYVESGTEIIVSSEDGSFVSRA